jgi:molecular chaperone GrpE
MVKDEKKRRAQEGPGEFDPELAEDLGAEFELRGDQLEEALEEARAQAEEWRDKAMRAQADFENTRKRLEVRHADALLRAGERIVEGLLPVLDDMDRAIEHAVGDGSDVADGLDAVRRKLLDVLAREGCEVIDPFGASFDHNKHNAVQVREDLEVADSTVVEVFQKGYEMHGRVLRPAMVVVSTGGPAGE